MITYKTFEKIRELPDIELGYIEPGTLVTKDIIYKLIDDYKDIDDDVKEWMKAQVSLT